MGTENSASSFCTPARGIKTMLTRLYSIETSAAARHPVYASGCEAFRFDTTVEDGMDGEKSALNQTSILPVGRKSYKGNGGLRLWNEPTDMWKSGPERDWERGLK